jgi:hypothetical protein
MTFLVDCKSSLASRGGLRSYAYCARNTKRRLLADVVDIRQVLRGARWILRVIDDELILFGMATLARRNLESKLIIHMTSITFVNTDTIVILYLEIYFENKDSREMGAA